MPLAISNTQISVILQCHFSLLLLMKIRLGNIHDLGRVPADICAVQCLHSETVYRFSNSDGSSQLEQLSGHCHSLKPFSICVIGVFYAETFFFKLFYNVIMTFGMWLRIDVMLCVFVHASESALYGCD